MESAQAPILTLAMLRLSAGLTQDELARRLGLNRMSVIRWESGRVRPSSRHLRALSSALGVPVNLLLSALDGTAA